MGVGCCGVGMVGNEIPNGGGGKSSWSVAGDKSKVKSHYGRATFFPETAQHDGDTDVVMEELEELDESDHEDPPVFRHAKCMSCAEDVVNGDGTVREGCNNLGSLFVDSIFALAEPFSDLVINSYEQDDGSVLFMLVEDTSAEVNEFEVVLQSSGSVMDVEVVDGGLLVSPRMFGVECAECGYENIIQRDQKVNLVGCKVRRLETQIQLNRIIDDDDEKSRGGDDYDDESFIVGNNAFSGLRYDPDYYLSQNGDSE